MAEGSLITLLNDASSKASSGDLLGALDDYAKATEIDQRSATAWYGSVSYTHLRAHET